MSIVKEQHEKKTFLLIIGLYFTINFYIGILPANIDNLITDLSGATQSGIALVIMFRLVFGTISMLLFGYFGEVLGSLPDPFTFWHSSQKNDPGLNLAGYENKEVDKLLKEARETLDESARKEKYETFQALLIEDAPCVFLYSPDYLYLISNKIKGGIYGGIKN